MMRSNRKFNRDEVEKWLRDMRISNPWFCVTSGNTYIIERKTSCGSEIYEATWNNCKTPIDDPQDEESAWTFDLDDMDIPDALFYADDETEAAIAEFENAEAE